MRVWCSAAFASYQRCPLYIHQLSGYHTSRTPVVPYYASLVTAGWPTDKVIFWALLSTTLSSHM